MSGRAGAPALPDPYERKRDHKGVRVLTVLVYVLCVSLAAIMLSLYYVFFWEPKDAHYAQRKVSHTVTRSTPLPTCFMPTTGRGDTAVSDNSTEAALDFNSTTTDATDAAYTPDATTYGADADDAGTRADAVLALDATAAPANTRGAPAELTVT